MNTPSRRSFISSAAVAAALGVSTGRKSSAQVSVGPFTKKYSFSVRPDVLSQLADDNSIVAANAWAVADLDQDLLPYLMGHLAVPLISDGASVCEPCSTSAQATAQWPVPQRFLNFRLLGELPSADLISDMVTARSEGRSLDLSISINDERSQPGAFVSGASGTTQFHPDYIRWPTPSVNGYFAQLRGPDWGGLAGCAPDAPKHFNLEVVKVNQWIPNTLIVNLHIAIWRQSSQICFALANSEGWPTCFKKCTPTWNDIYQGVLSALSSKGMNYFIASTLAALLATLMFGSLALLAVAA